MAKRGAAGDVARHGGNVDVAEALLFVADVSFFFEQAKLGADCGVAGFVGEIREDVAHRSALELVENVHDLAFAAGGGGWVWGLRHWRFFQQPFQKNMRLSRS